MDLQKTNRTSKKSQGENLMGYRRLVQNTIGHRYHQFVEQKRKVSESVDTPIRKSCWCGEIVEEA